MRMTIKILWWAVDVIAAIAIHQIIYSLLKFIEKKIRTTNNETLLRVWLNEIASDIRIGARMNGFLFAGIYIFSRRLTQYYIAYIKLSAIALSVWSVVIAIAFLYSFEKIQIKKTRADSSLSARDKTFQLTFIPLAISTIKYILYGLEILLVLAIMGVDIAPVVRASGLIALVLAYAGNEVLKDIIESAFIFFERMYYVGSTIRVCGHTGVVAKITWRNTFVETEKGTYIVANRNVDKIFVITLEPDETEV